MNKEDIKALIEDINVTLLPSGELLVDTKYAKEAKSVRLMDREGFTKVFEEPKVGEWEIEEIRSIYGEGYRLTCSECGDTFTVTENAFPYERYCRHCGAKMERSKE